MLGENSRSGRAVRVKVKESSVGSIGFVGGVKRPEAKSTDNGKDDSSGPTVN